MGKIYAEIDDTLDLKFRELILKKFGPRRGALQAAVTEAIKLWVEKESKLLQFPQDEPQT